MSDVLKSTESIEETEPYLKQTVDVDPAETQEWLESLDTSFRCWKPRQGLRVWIFR